MDQKHEFDTSGGPAMPGPGPGGISPQALILGIVGGVVGGAVGVVLFGWVLRQGFYALLLPGALTGLGCWTLARRRSLTLGIVCGVVGLGLGLFAEWHYRPFLADPGFGYFITHLHDLTRVTLLMTLGGALLGFWFGRGRG